MRDCSDVGKKSVEDEAECQVAASQLGFSYDQDGSWNFVPKGCLLFLKDNHVYYNNHETGRIDNDTLSICRKGNNNSHLHCIELFKIKYLIKLKACKLDDRNIAYPFMVDR